MTRVISRPDRDRLMGRALGTRSCVRCRNAGVRQVRGEDAHVTSSRRSRGELETAGTSISQAHQWLVLIEGLARAGALQLDGSPPRQKQMLSELLDSLTPGPA